MELAAHGHLVDYELRGEGATVVLVHGLGTDRRIMIDRFDELLAARGLRRLYLDLPGHGRSRAAAEGLSADGLVELLATLVRRELPPAGEGALEAPLLVGYAYGGYLAQGLVRALGGAAGLFLVCPVVEPDLARRRLPPRQRLVARELVLPEDERARAAFEELAVQRTPPVLADFMALVHPASLGVDAAAVASLRARYQCSRPLGRALAELAAPVTIVCGRDDHWTGWQDATLLVDQLLSPHFVVLPDCGQLLPFEQPGAFAQAVRDWLDRAIDCRSYRLNPSIEASLEPG